MMPVINIQILSGRTAAQKSALIAALAETSMRTLEIPEEAIRVLLIEIPPENWGVGSRTIANCEVRLRSISKAAEWRSSLAMDRIRARNSRSHRGNYGCS